MSWRGYSSDPCYQRSVNRSQRNFLLQNVAVTSISRKAGGGYTAKGGGPKTAPACPGEQRPTAKPPEDPPAKKRYVDQQMYKDLQEAADTGRGITKAELKNVVSKHAEDGPKGLLTKTERAALDKAIENDLFATSKGSAAAKQLAEGKPLSIIGIRSL